MFKLDFSYLNHLISTSALGLAAVACGPAVGPVQDPIITENTTETKTLALTFEGLEALGG